MVDWNTGLPNARYRVLQLLLDEVQPGCGLVPMTGAPDSCYLLGLHRRDARKILVVNKTNGDVALPIAGVRGARARIVDQSSAGGPIRTERVRGDRFAIGGYGVAILVLPG
jgi:hypothetical protein